MSALYELGSKIYFTSDKKPFTVKAADNRFIICTKPFNLKRTVLYSIIDLKKDVRGPNNLVFNMYDYTNQKEIDDCLRDLQSGEIEVSKRRCIPLDISFKSLR